MNIEALHEEAEWNKYLINTINSDPQSHIDMCFLNKFRDQINNWFDKYLEQNIHTEAINGSIEDTEYFTITNRHLDNLRFGPGITSTIFNPFTFVDLSNIPMHNSYVYLKNNIVSINGIKVAYDYWISKFKELNDIKIIHIDDFNLSKKEYKKLCKSWFKFEKTFTIKISF